MELLVVNMLLLLLLCEGGPSTLKKISQTKKNQRLPISPDVPMMTKHNNAIKYFTQDKEMVVENCAQTNLLYSGGVCSKYALSLRQCISKAHPITKLPIVEIISTCLSVQVELDKKVSNKQKRLACYYWIGTHIFFLCQGKLVTIFYFISN